eukprot:TRINITY_DN1924_c0_g1_i13.p1 TRINITY_DN1924_c0_g1~~TRINITY_DN1924_c0_g1_i13.p1  ORF type:complete len:378 (-),score=90.74 TRINITY_DN1924_c0_g1_i13:140-1273(-)
MAQSRQQHSEARPLESQVEVNDHRVHRLALLFHRLDTGGSGNLNKQELMASFSGDAAKLFAALDTDSDGLVSTVEWQALFAKMQGGLGEAKSLAVIQRLEEAEVQHSRKILLQAHQAAHAQPVELATQPGALVNTQKKMMDQLTEKDQQLEQSESATQSLQRSLEEASTKIAELEAAASQGTGEHKSTMVAPDESEADGHLDHAIDLIKTLIQDTKERAGGLERHLTSLQTQAGWESPSSVDLIDNDLDPAGMICPLLRQLSSQLNILFNLIRALTRSYESLRMETEHFNPQQLGCLGGMQLCLQATMQSISNQIDTLRANTQAGNRVQESPHYSFQRVAGDTSEEEGNTCLLYTSDAADEEDSGDLGGRRIIKKKK